ncbi:LamG domain-containing protein [Maribacter arcticus]|uniref:Concanavalin A-like lectin/glucanases superfamily protein n=1 Tax=Maribacter arcticus TaxID=561365 RepID=A0A1T4ZQL5_9FLAO|nr:LamG domain-containing protein [Maribacter arcticus]SKB25006.1 Concanavalin A-like lectin/glucanases superfamily protein [Maribacter arcticus]
MIKLLKYTFFLVLVIGIAHYGNAQSYETLPNDKKLALRLRSHVFLNLDSIRLNRLESVLKSQTPIAVALSKKKSVNISFLEAYKKYHDSLLVLSDKNVATYISERITILLISDKLVKKLFLQDSLTLIKTRHQTTAEMYLVSSQKRDSFHAQNYFDFWNSTGKLPNFIEAQENTLAQIDSLVIAINTLPKVYGMTHTKEGLLPNVTFKNFRNSTISGFFSFPVLATESTLPILIPYKAGYNFSPDIIYTSQENINNPKDFMGLPLDIDFGFTDRFTFEKSIQNRIRKNSEEIISNNVGIVQDSTLGSVGFFEKRAYVDAGLKSKSALQSDFTITAWVKPTELGRANSILGKGESFIVKIHDGFLTFTMADIKDYISTSSLVPSNEWTHIALVYSKLKNELLFYINGKETDRIVLISEYEPSNFNILIGSNLWEEFFVGYLGDIKIWERELNTKEIVSQYTNFPEEISTNKYRSLWIAISITFSSILSFLFWNKRRRKKAGEPKKLCQETAVSLKDIYKSNTRQDFKQRIHCFGPLCIFDEEEINVAKKFSPKLKEVFLVIFLYSQKNGKGLTTKQLTELLWPGMTNQEAKNTRGTTIQNLRTLLSTCPDINLDFRNKYWYMQVGEDCYLDYRQALNYIRYFEEVQYETSILEKELPKLLALLSNGRLLSSSSSSWLDPFIENFTNQVIEACTLYSQNLNYKKHQELLLQLVEVIYLYDDLNEMALRLKLQILIQQGMLSLAHTVHANFAKLYLKLYNVEYHPSFKEMVSKYQS